MRQNIQVPFGYEPPVMKQKGTLIFYDSFEETTDEQLSAAMNVMEDRDFQKLVLYPLHEETIRRMWRGKSTTPLYRRKDRLHDWIRQHGNKHVLVEGWEEKRKKYTPFEAAMRQLTEHNPAPYFLYITPEMANLLASYSSFEEWIKKMRMLVTGHPEQLHSQLLKYQDRWSCVDSAK